MKRERGEERERKRGREKERERGEEREGGREGEREGGGGKKEREGGREKGEGEREGNRDVHGGYLLNLLNQNLLSFDLTLQREDLFYHFWHTPSRVKKGNSYHRNNDMHYSCYPLVDIITRYKLL